MLEYNFTADKSLIGWLFIDQYFIGVHYMFNLMDSYLIFVFILIFFPLIFDLRFICLWWIH